MSDRISIFTIIEGLSLSHDSDNLLIY